MHLTNYAINKHSEDFIRDDEAGSKRRISTTNRYMREKGYDVDKMWADIDDVIIKTLISAHSVLKHNYRTCFPNHVKGSACFEILGFDVILDRKLRPYVIEVSSCYLFLTYLWQVDASTILLWTGPFPIEGVTVWLVFITMFCRNSCIECKWCRPSLKLHYAVSDLDLHCLPVSLLRDARNWCTVRGSNSFRALSPF